MGSDYNTAGAQKPAAVLNTFSKYLPGLEGLSNQQVPLTANAQLQAANEMVNPSDPVALAEANYNSAMAALKAAQTTSRTQDQYGKQVNIGIDKNAVKAAQDKVNSAMQAWNQAKAMPQVKGVNELNLEQLQKFGLPEAQEGQKITDSNTQAGASTIRNVINGAGGDAARSAVSLNKELNPALSTAIDASTEQKKIADSISLNGLSPGEASSVERSLNKTNTATGNAGLVNPTNVIADAMNFGGAFNNKVQMKSALEGAAGNSAVAASTTQNSQVNPLGVATMMPNPGTQSNFGSGQFVNINPATGATASGNALNFSQGMLNALTSGNNAAQSAGASMANATSPASYLGEVCCFIFLEAYNGKLPKCVRKGRDKYYAVNPSIAAGYRLCAYHLVPLMRSNSFVRSIVNLLMVIPITRFLEHPKKGINKRITHFWLRAWAVLGKGKNERDFAMPWEYRYV